MRDDNHMPNEFRLAVTKRLARNIERLSERDHLTRYEIEQRTGIGHTTLWHWVSGYSLPTADKLLWLCKCLHWKLGEVLGGGKRDE